MGLDGPISIGPATVLFVGRLSADDFFDGLDVSETNHGLVYTKHSKPFLEYPSKVSVTLLTWVRENQSSAAEDASTANEILSKFHISVKWKTDLKLRDAKDVHWTFRQPSTQEWKMRSETQRLMKLGLGTGVPSDEGLWLFEIAVKDTLVPLTDSLIVVVSTDGKDIARLSARL